MLGSIYQGDSLEINIIVQSGSNPMNLTGVSVAGGALKTEILDADTNRRETRVPATASVVSAIDGTAKLFFAAGLLSVGDWQVALRVTDEDEVQTVWTDTVTVLPSIVATP